MRDMRIGAKVMLKRVPKKNDMKMRNAYRKCWKEILKEIDHLKDPGIDRSLILN